MNRQAHEIGAVLRDGEAIDRAIASAHRRVILRHRQLGIPLAMWQDGRVVEIAPEHVDLPRAVDEVDGGA